MSLQLKESWKYTYDVLIMHVIKDSRNRIKTSNDIKELTIQRVEQNRNSLTTTGSLEIDNH